MIMIYKVGPYRLMQCKKQRRYLVQVRIYPFFWWTSFKSTYLYPAEHEFRRVAFDAHIGEAF